MRLTCPDGTSQQTFTVTDAEVNGGSFNLKLVKEGAGVFIPQMYNLSYTGGNVVSAGTLKIYNNNNADSNTYAFDQNNYPRPLGTYGVPLVVEEGAVLDLNGNYGTNRLHVRLNGGTIVSSKEQGRPTWGGFDNVTLTTNSSINAGNNIVCSGGSGFNLGGYELTWNISSGKAIYLRTAVRDGTWKTVGAGTFQTVDIAAGSQTMDLDAGTQLNLGTTLTVRDYTARYSGTSNAGTAAMNVYGVFTPVTDKFYGCTMQNGSTLDLTSKTEVWSTTGAFTNGLSTVTFAANSVVNVALAADRELTFDANGLAQVVSWETEPPETTKFKLAGPARERKRPLLRRPGGLYLMRATMMIIVR